MIRIRVERFRIGLTIPASMPKITTLDKQWQQLMSLCESESRFRAQGSHPRLLNLVASEIDQLATQMGFSAQRIATRDFRAERHGDHIIALVTE